jgi:hypothetical protein
VAAFLLIAFSNPWGGEKRLPKFGNLCCVSGVGAASLNAIRWRNGNSNYVQVTRLADRRRYLYRAHMVRTFKCTKWWITKRAAQGSHNYEARRQVLAEDDEQQAGQKIQAN